MAEQRAEGQVFLALVDAPVVVVGAGPHRPRIRADRMAGRAQGEDVDHHRLVVAHPVMVDEAALGEPAHRDQRCALLQPGPVHLLVQGVGDLPDLFLARVVAVVVRLREQHAHHQQRGIDRGQFDPAVVAPAFLHVQEVVVEALVAGLAGALRAHRHVAEEFQGGQGAVDRLVAADPAVLDADRIRGQGEADRGDAGERPRRIAVRGQAVDLVGGIPEELEGAALDVIEQRRQLGLHRSRRRIGLDQDHRRPRLGGLLLGRLAGGDGDGHRRSGQQVACLHGAVPPGSCSMEEHNVQTPEIVYRIRPEKTTKPWSKAAFIAHAAAPCPAAAWAMDRPQPAHAVGRCRRRTGGTVLHRPPAIRSGSPLRP